MNIFKKLKKKIKSVSGNSLAEFAVTTAMMATLATTAAPRFSGIGEGAKEKKTLAEIDKIIIGIDSLSHLQTNLDTLKKKISQKNYKIIDQINLHDNKIIKPYLW